MVKNHFAFPARVALGSAERKSIKQCLDYYEKTEEDLPYGGRFFEQYSNALCKYFGANYALPVCSGTVALFIAIRSLRLQEGSTVICSPITDPGCISAIVMNGLKVKLCDTRQHSFSMDTQCISEQITNDVSAVLYVHACGHATDLTRLREHLDQNGIKLIEDISQAHGAASGNKLAGSFGHVAAISTMYRKAHITGSNGGAVLTNSFSVFSEAVKHADRGKNKFSSSFEPRDPKNYDLPALNFNLDELSCAIGTASLARLPHTIECRLKYVDTLRSMVAGTNFLISDLSETDSPFIIPVRCPDDWSVDDKMSLAAHLHDNGIPHNPHYRYLVTEWKDIQNLHISPGYLPNALFARDHHLCLYINEKYTEKHAEHTSSILRNFKR